MEYLTNSKRVIGMAEAAAIPGARRSVRPFVGRTAELDALERMLDELDRGRWQALALVGEPGIGKSRLLAEFGARADQRAHLVLSGSASESESELPFSVFVNALDEYVAGLDPRGLDLDDDVQAHLAHVFPSFRTGGRRRSATLQQERYLAHRAVRALLQRLAVTRPLILVLDDVHWADAASVEQIGSLLRKPPTAPVAIALGLRARQVPHHLSVVLERAERAEALTRIELRGLGADDARALVRASVDDGEISAILAEGGGNPFYLEQLARSLADAGRNAAAVHTSGVDVGVPEGVAAALREELDHASDRARLLLDGAAVAGDPFELDLAASAAELSDVAARESVDELLQLDLLRQTDAPRRFRFRHPLLRRAVYETTPAGWRLGAHERCADALAAQGSPPVARAHHVERSARHGDLAAVKILREAGEAAARLAPASAAHWFGAALGLLPDGAPSTERVALLLARATSLAATGHFAESRVEILRGVEIALRDAPEWRVRVVTACAAVEHLLGLRADAHKHLVTALADLESASPHDAAALMIELAVDGLHAGDVASMRAWADRAVATARQQHDRGLLAAALAVRASASATAGDSDQGRRQCDEAMELIDALSDEELARRLDAAANLATAELFLDRFSAAAHHARRALEIGRTTGQGDLVPLIYAMLGGSLWIQGSPSEADHLLEGAVEAARLSGNLQSLAWMLFNHSMAALVAGDLEVALEAAEESVELEHEMDGGLISAMAAAVLATVRLETGDAEGAVEVMVEHAGGDEIRLIGGGWRVRFLEVLTRALLATGRNADAERAAATAEAYAREVGLASAFGLAGLAVADLALDRGNATTAAERALASAEALDSVGAVWDAARAREVAGRALAREGQREQAVLELERAAAAFDSFGSVRYRSQAERELRKLGRRIHRRTQTGSRGTDATAALTARELEITRLVVDRWTNPEIASALFLSPKTVETHLHNVFNKMGVADRVALARAFERARGTSGEGRHEVTHPGRHTGPG